jgi:hypothetical protein
MVNIFDLVFAPALATLVPAIVIVHALAINFEIYT